VNFWATGILTAANFPNSTPTNLSDAASLYLLTGRVSAINRTVALGEDTKTFGSSPTIDRNHYRQIALHVQDAWRVRPSLTLNYGVRWEKPLSYVNQSGIYTRPTYAGLWGVSGVGNLFKPGVLTGSLPQFFATDPDTKAYLSTNKNFAPSVGFAWTLPQAAGPLSWLLGRGQAVLRGGYAISTIRPDAGAFSGAWGNKKIATAFIFEAAVSREGAHRRLVDELLGLFAGRRRSADAHRGGRGRRPLRQRILDDPDLFFKTQRLAEEKSPAGTGAELLRDLEMVAAIVNRAQRRLTGAAAADLDTQQSKAARYQIERIQKHLRRIGETIPPEKELHVEPSATHHDSGTEHSGSEQTGDRAGVRSSTA
jgi:hypothetical protein